MQCTSPFTLPCTGGPAIHTVTLSGSGVRRGIYHLCHGCFVYVWDSPRELYQVTEHEHWTVGAEREHPGILRILARVLGGDRQSPLIGGSDEWTN